MVDVVWLVCTGTGRRVFSSPGEGLRGESGVEQCGAVGVLRGEEGKGVMSSLRLHHLHSICWSTLELSVEAVGRSGTGSQG